MQRRRRRTELLPGCPILDGFLPLSGDRTHARGHADYAVVRIVKYGLPTPYKNYHVLREDDCSTFHLGHCEHVVSKFQS